MLTIIHGENLKQSRDCFWQLKQKAKSPIYLNAEETDILYLMQIFKSSGFFEEKKTVFIENLFSFKKGDEKEKILKIILENEKENEIILWQNKEIRKADLKKFINCEIKKFDIPQKIFLFLDNLGINKKKSLELFHEILKTEETEYVFFMIVRHFRIMLSLQENKENQIDELKRILPWQRQKYEKQLKFIGFEKAKNFYSNLFKTDLKQKTGQNALSFIQTIDILLLKI